MTARHVRQSGSALILVLWLAAAMTAIAFALASTVRTETERAQVDSEGLRAYYLACGSIERALLWLQWGPRYRNPDGSPMFYQPPIPRLSFAFPSGVAVVELIPESSKINVNRTEPEVLYRLLLVLGVEKTAPASLLPALSIGGKVPPRSARVPSTPSIPLSPRLLSPRMRLFVSWRSCCWSEG